MGFLPAAFFVAAQTSRHEMLQGKTAGTSQR
jgi:hypothetical protein